MEDKRNQISDWLEKLQQESWHLELLISGFSIFLLIQTGGGILEYLKEINFHTELIPVVYGLLVVFLGICQIAAYVLTFNLLIHVLLRGFWIGAIGLRSVQDRIEYEKLNYSYRFTKYLEKSTFNLDNLLIRLDNICSVIFAFTFLIVFMLLSLSLSLTFLGGFIYLLDQLFDFIGMTGTVGATIKIGLIIFLLFTALIYALDTLTLGFFKKFNWLSKFYYPIHRFWGAITLSKVYRGIYYSLISRFSKRQIRLVLTPIILLTVFIPFFKFDQYVFFPDSSSTQGYLQHSIYENQLTEEDRITRAAIPSMIIRKDWIPLFIRYDVADNDDIYKHCGDYQPSKQPGLISGISFKNGLHIRSPNVIEENPEKLLNCLSSYYDIYLNDSLHQQLDFYFYQHPHREEQGLMTVLPVAYLENGKHVIDIQRRIITQADSIRNESYIRIPFWLE